MGLGGHGLGGVDIEHLRQCTTRQAAVDSTPPAPIGIKIFASQVWSDQIEMLADFFESKTDAYLIQNMAALLARPAPCLWRRWP